MTIDTIAGIDLELNGEGFLTDPSQWNEDVATELARREGIDPLTERHWQVIRFMRSEFQAKGTGPTVRVLGKTSGVPIKELYQLFPKGPAKLAAKIAGIPQASRLHLTFEFDKGAQDMGDRIEKVSIIISKGSLEGVYPGLIMANGARAEGIEANLFFTFFGLDAIHAKRLERMKVAAVGNPGMHMASLIGVLPGMSAIATHMMEKKMEEHDIPDLHEFMEMIADTGCGMYACQASVELFGFTKADFIPQVHDIITVGEFYEKAAGGQIIFT